MMDGLFGGDDDDEPDVDDDADPLLEDDGDDLLGDDGLGGDDLGDDDMVFDDMDDDGAAATSELENRMDELENELGSLSSTVNTVKSENEQISESVDDIEENIRKLLEVYEMVTRGVNPFVNEDELGDAFGSGGAGGGAGGSMGLFGGDDEAADEDDLDEDIAGADATDFFDEDVLDEDDAFADDAFDDGGDAFDGGDDPFGDDAFDDGDDAFDDGDDDSDGGKSFEELKDEYENGSADWEDDDAGDSQEAKAAEVDEPAGQDDPLDIDAADDDPLETADDETGADAGVAAASSDVGGDDRRPHLASLPAGYVSDVLVMEWLEFLVDQGGIDGAAKSIAYYESIGWLSESAAEELQTFLNGFGEPVELQSDGPPQSPLRIESHRTSLRYVSRLASSSMGVDVMDRLDAPATARNTPNLDAHARGPASDGQPPGGAPVGQPSHNGNGNEFAATGDGVQSDGGHPATDPFGNPVPGPERTGTKPADDGGRIGVPGQRTGEPTASDDQLNAQPDDQLNAQPDDQPDDSQED